MLTTNEEENESCSEKSSFFDPFQIFEVNAQKCHVLRVTVQNSVDKPKGWVFSLFHTPDLYVMLHVPNTPNGVKRTRTVGNSLSPTWNETLTFLLSPDESYILEVVLMDANLLRNDTKVGEAQVPLNDLPLNEQVTKEILFSKATQAMCATLSSINFSTGLYCLDHPGAERRVPCIGLLGSGGGFRAMVGLSGAMKALHESGAFDCLTYLASLSGGSWYISYLYSQAGFQEKGPAAYHEELRQNICQNNWLKLLTPSGVFGYIAAILRKSKTGQPVSLTDFFGHVVGDSVLGKERKNCKLSEQALKLENGDVPLPLYTCINVKKNVSARVYQDWIEFSPYEIGFAKYGTFMKPRHFGSKFFLGKVVQQYDEPPLHYLQGIWGSAYCILFKRMIKERWKKDFPEMTICNLIEEDLEEDLDEESTLTDTLWASCAEDQPDSSSTNMDHNHVFTETDSDSDTLDASFVRLLEKQKQSIEDCMASHLETGADREPIKSADGTDEEASSQDTGKEINEAFSDQSTILHKCAPFTTVEAAQNKTAVGPECRESLTQSSYWFKKLESLLESKFMNNRSGRAGLIFNPLRGLNLTVTYPISPFITPTTPDDDDDFKGLFEPVEVQAKQLFLVDSGLTFNLPFPLLVRPQRAVDIYLMFDFSTRSSDNVTPFRELLHVEKWAILNKVPFPPVEEQVNIFLKEPLRECYVFDNVKDPYCPIIIQFILLNDKFRLYKTPGVKRKTEEEKQFANFNIFSDPKAPFSLYNFSYTQQQFDRLSSLMEFNTLYSLPVIREQMARAVARKRHLPPKPPIKLCNIPLMQLKSRPKSIQKLQNYVKSMTMINMDGQNDSVPEDNWEDEALLKEFYYEKIQEHYARQSSISMQQSSKNQSKEEYVQSCLSQNVPYQEI